MSKKGKSRICYLCGKAGADSRDHVPPKSLLPPGTDSQKRITVAAHRACNSAPAADEEYVRDLLMPEAIQFDYQDAEEPYRKTWRAWSKPAGWKRYQEFMAEAKPIELRTKSGLYAGRAIGIPADRERLESVVRKIARGIIFYDSHAFAPPSKVGIALVSAGEAVELSEKDAEVPYWRAMRHPACKHTQLADGVALRRFYQGHGTPEGSVVIETHLALMLWNLFVVSSLAIPIERVKKSSFKFVIDNESGEWVRGDNAEQS